MTDIPGLGFHAHGGWYFRREDDGEVRIFCPDSSGARQTAVFDAHTWASIVAAVSARGETSDTYQQALDAHQRED